MRSDAWPYPMSENETRNVFEFQLNHPNIVASVHYHNTGRPIMFMAPPDTRTDLGDVWTGGTSKKHAGRTPPAQYMETEALRQTHFALYCAAQFPKVEIDAVTVTPATGDLF